MTQRADGMCLYVCVRVRACVCARTCAKSRNIHWFHLKDDSTLLLLVGGCISQRIIILQKKKKIISMFISEKTLLSLYYK